MKTVMMFVLLVAQVMLCTYPTSAQDYPFWLNDSGQKYNEYPTAIASAPDVVATVGFYEEKFNVDDISYTTFYSVPCIYCNNKENIFVNWREEGTSNTWTALISARNGSFNNQVNVQSAPQVDVTSSGDVYVSFTYRGSPLLTDASGRNVSINPSSNLYNLAVVKFDYKGDYQWHFTEGGASHAFVTDLDYNEHTNKVAIAGYLLGNASFLFDGSILIDASVSTSVLPGLPYGHAFSAVYNDNGSNANISWGRNVGVSSYSTDVVQDNAGNVFLSGIFQAKDGNTINSINIAGLRVTDRYVEPNTSTYKDYFLVKFEPNSTPAWAEIYGAKYNELQIAPDKRLRYSSLAIDPLSSDLYFALSSTGGNSTIFTEFGTYVNYINSSNGTINHYLTVGTTKTVNATSNICPDTKYGSATYNPSITVDEKGHVVVAGNFLITRNSTAPIIAPFYEVEIGGTLLDQGMTTASNFGYSTSVGSYTAMIDFGTPIVYNEQLNPTYVPANSNNPYNQLPVYGIAQDINHSAHFYHILGFNYGKLELDLNTNLGIVNTYDNANNGTPQFDGLIMRNYVKNGQLSKRQNVTTTSTATKEEKSLKELSSTDVSWVLSPNPVASGQSLLWKNESGEEVVDYIRLMDMTGRVLKIWNTPQATAQGFQLPIGNLVAGTYLLEASGTAVKQSTLVVVK